MIKSKPWNFSSEGKVKLLVLGSLLEKVKGNYPLVLKNLCSSSLKLMIISKKFMIPFFNNLF